jgi:phospholipid transport system substrate-binding protein
MCFGVLWTARTESGARARPLLPRTEVETWVEVIVRRKGQETMAQVPHVSSMVVPVMLAAALAFASLPAAAQSPAGNTGANSPVAQPQPLDVVKSSITRVLAANGNGQQRVEVRRAAEELFDFDEMARRVLAERWQESSPYQRGEFVRLFTDLLERSYLRGLRSVPLAAVTFLGETVKGPYAQVKSSVATSRFGETSVEYRMVDHGDRWAVYDVVLDGVSLVSSYRSQFASILRTSSFAQLLEKLQNRQQIDARVDEGP